MELGYILSLQVIYKLSFNENQCVATEVDRRDIVTQLLMSQWTALLTRISFFVTGLHNISKFMRLLEGIKRDWEL